jgi:transmembrane sensor
MNIPTSIMDADHPEGRADAERWFARLKAPDCTASERMAFQRWRAIAEHAEAYEATERLWESLGKLSGRRDLEQLSQQILAASGPLKRAHGRRYLAAAAAALIAVLGVAVALRSAHHEIPVVVYSTKPGERSIIRLADGSQLVLNYATQLDVRLGNDVRRLTLHKGEALFTVAHDPMRPFKVDAGGGEVTAIGTRFEVRNDAERVAVTLLEGRVAVDRQNTNEHVELKPGDQVRFSASLPQMTQRTVDPEVVASWSTGRLRFRATPLGETLDEVNRYSTTQIRIADPGLIRTPVSGTFEIGDTASVVAALQALLPIQAQEKDGEILLTPRN